MLLSKAETGSAINLCLIKNIYHEARGEPFSGMVAVAQVTLNRARGGDICKVVYADKQFSWTSKERPMKDFNSVKLAMLAIQVVEKGDAYLFLDPKLMKADHYHADNVKPSWANKMRKVAHVGKHHFYIAQKLPSYMKG